ncbi:YheC/YheD family protein [Paenibacillus sp. N3.4]|uniref:YheC/YheD family protein n=1 Tax=Paenibacillus sp. N3.4 TaxID=2603222 RepID=UPI0011CAC23C|nr:YheC/YheD family protein [Paenibacillus sp. N3.4]TXK75466.1 hypothetical protein FU659_27315 [Paenibacillus sp. N3.4]
MRHKIIRSKMKKGKTLMNDPILSRHVPKTYWYRTARLRNMLNLYSAVYIKPDIGRKGNGVIRVRKLNDLQVEISNRNNTIKCSKKELRDEIKKLMSPERKYLVQQGINLATYHGHPFDVRIVLQKPLRRWRVSLMTAKVAPHQHSVVTNISKGAKDVNVIKVLQGIDQSVNGYKILRDLIDTSHQIAQLLGSRFPLKIVGLDMAIDKKGKIWFIEANTKPDNSGLQSLDRGLYRRYLESRRWIKRSR